MNSENTKTSKTLGLGIVLLVLGAILTAAVYFLGGSNGTRRILFSLLLNFSFFTSIALGALCWVTLHHLTHAGWSVVVRRFGEAIGASIALLAFGGAALLLFLPEIYHWADSQVILSDRLIQAKVSYLNETFFIIRYIAYFAIWIFISRYFLGKSRKQDASGDPALTLGMERFSPMAMILLALSISFFSFDLIMSLDAHWFSTIFGVYFFSGAMVAFFSVLALVAVGARWSTGLNETITVEHLHDIGKLMLTFIVFWAYIAFSQYLLIWYGNLPEETVWLYRRQAGQWMTLTYVLLIGHFIIPFFGLMSRWPKRRGGFLAAWAVYILVMHYLDLYWLIMPEFMHGSTTLGFALSDATLFLLMAGVFLVGVALPLRKTAAVPQRDPRLDESLSFENM